VAGCWRRLYDEELHNLYASPDFMKAIKSWRMSWVGHVARMGKMRSAYKILFRKPERKRPLGIRGRTWEDNVRIDLKEIECALGAFDVG